MGKSVNDEMITKETAVREILFWLKRGRLLGFIAVGGCFLAALAAVMLPMAGGIIGFFSAVSAAFLLKTIVEQIKRLELKYGFKTPDPVEKSVDDSKRI